MRMGAALHTSAAEDVTAAALHGRRIGLARGCRHRYCRIFARARGRF